MKVLAVNVGSSSLKISLYLVDKASHELLLKFHIKGLRSAHVVIETRSNIAGILSSKKETFPQKNNIEQLLQHVLSDLLQVDLLPDRVAHRIVHGGECYFQATKINPQVLSDLSQLSALAPLHQPPALEVVKLLQKILPPNIEQFACFDTAFHQGLADYKTVYALPESLRKQGIRRYGFHGLSYQQVYRQLCDQQPEQFNRRVIIAHLGSGVSVCAIYQGKSQDFSMGFSALEGPVMSTRAGRIDAGIILKLLFDGYSKEQLEQLLFKDSGWAALSEVGSDMSEILKLDNEHCQLAVEHFVFQVTKEISALLPALKGLDTLVFTGGVGENSPKIRNLLCQQLNWLGLEINEQANINNQFEISGNNSKIQVNVIQCNEELAMVQQVTEITLLN